MPKMTRRRMLGGTSAALGAGTIAVLSAAPAEAAATTLVLVGSQMRSLGGPGRVLPGSSSTVRGLLHAKAGGPKVGEFFANGTVLAESQMFEPALGSFESHLFTTPRGTITGTGVVQHDGTGRFTVTGGSGDYAGARGTYTSRQTADPYGTGQALFTFTLDGAR